jgi:hypothetical protein
MPTVYYKSRSKKRWKVRQAVSLSEQANSLFYFL